MHDNGIHKHIAAAGARSQSETTRLTARMVSNCWPGGSADRFEPAAQRWLRRWRPATCAAGTPVCACGHGHCLVCN